jgi:hypothetical protein
MVFAIFGWILLWRRPSWGMLVFLANCVGVLQLGLSYINIIRRLDEYGATAFVGDFAPAIAMDYGIALGVFLGAGTLIVLGRNYLLRPAK